MAMPCSYSGWSGAPTPRARWLRHRGVLRPAPGGDPQQQSACPPRVHLFLFGDIPDPPSTTLTISVTRGNPPSTCPGNATSGSSGSGSMHHAGEYPDAVSDWVGARGGRHQRDAHHHGTRGPERTSTPTHWWVFRGRALPPARRRACSRAWCRDAASPMSAPARTPTNSASPISPTATARWTPPVGTCQNMSLPIENTPDTLSFCIRESTAGDLAPR